jgi:hypothetical protein
VSASRAYDPVPCYPCAEGDTSAGWQSLCAHLPSRGYALAIDGPEILDWDQIAAAVTGQLRRRGADLEVLDVHMSSREQIRKRTASAALVGDPDFTTIPDCALADLFDEVPVPPDADSLILVVGGFGQTEHEGGPSHSAAERPAPLEAPR